MSIEAAWINEDKTAILMTFDGKWTWDDAYDIMSTVQTMAETVDHTVHLISDLRKSGPLPTGMSITHTRNVMRLQPPNAGLVIIITHTAFFRTLAETFNKVFSGGIGSRIHIVADMEAAMNLVEQQSSDQAWDG